MRVSGLGFKGFGLTVLQLMAMLVFGEVLGVWINRSTVDGYVGVWRGPVSFSVSSLVGQACTLDRERNVSSEKVPHHVSLHPYIPIT